MNQTQAAYWINAGWCDYRDKDLSEPDIGRYSKVERLLAGAGFEMARQGFDPIQFGGECACLESEIERKDTLLALLRSRVLDLEKEMKRRHERSESEWALARELITGYREALEQIRDTWATMSDNVHSNTAKALAEAALDPEGCRDMARINERASEANND